MDALFVLAILGGLGYMANNTKRSSHEDPPAWYAPPPESTTTAQALTDEFHTQVSSHMKKPNVIIGGQSDLSNMPFFNSQSKPTHTPFVPFFKSEKSQNTSDVVKDRRLETFTGVNNTDYAPKMERVADTPIEGLTSIYGTTFKPDIDRYKSYMTNARQHNVGPVEKQYVGPGLGLPATQAASGGFHDRFRILPDNVNAYRKNTFGGEVVLGKSQIDHRDTSDASAATQDLSTSNLRYSEQQTLGNRPFAAVHSSVAAQAGRPNASASKPVTTNRSQPNSACLVGGPNSHVDLGYVYGEGTRVRETTLPQCAMGGAHRSGIATGGYHREKFLTTDNNRETANCQRLNVGTQSTAGTYKTPEFTSMASQRGNQFACPDQQFGGASNASNGSVFPSRDGWNAERTQRELTLTERVGIVGSGVSTGGYTGVQNKASLRTTQRGDDSRTHVDLSGPANAHISHNLPHSATVHATHASRELATVMNHVPNVQTTANHMHGVDHHKQTVTTARSDQNKNRILSNGKGMGENSFASRTQLGQVFASDNEFAIENQRDFGYAPSNPLRTDVRSLFTSE